MTTPYHSHYWAQLLTLKSSSDSMENLSRSFSGARVDLNPHQVDAALFAFRSPLSKDTIPSSPLCWSRLAMGPSEFQALRLTKIEMARFAVLQEVQRRSTRIFDQPRITSPRAASSYLLPKVQGWTEERFGMLSCNAKGYIDGQRLSISQNYANEAPSGARPHSRNTSHGVQSQSQEL